MGTDSEAWQVLGTFMMMCVTSMELYGNRLRGMASVRHIHDDVCHIHGVLWQQTLRHGKCYAHS